jgi:serine protease
MRFWLFLKSIAVAVFTLVKAIFMGNQLLRAIQFLIMVCTILLAFLSAIEPIIRLPVPRPPVEEPKPEPGYLVLDLLDNPEPQHIAVIEQMLDSEFEFTDSTTVDEGIGTIWVDNLANAVDTLATLSFVESAEPAVYYTTIGWFPQGWPDGPPDDPMYSQQWNMEMIGAPYAWAHTPQGKGVIVAVIDTGVTQTQDLKGTHVLPGKSFTGEAQRDGNGHGTHVAGTIAQTTNNGIGVTGIAPQATILPVKVLTDAGSGRHDWIAAGIRYAVDEGAKVINMSLGGPPGRVVEDAVNYARDAGVLVVCACGNSSTDECGFPAGYEKATGVSSVGPDGKLAFYSDYGKGVDIAAPGGNKNLPNGGILQNTILRGKDVYEQFQGTSMASPHVAGAAAVLISTGLSVDDAERVLLETATDGPEEEFGNGLLNLQAAVKHSSPTGEFVMHLRPIAMAALITLLLGWLGSVSRDYTTTAIASTVLTTGGLFFLPMLPIPDLWYIMVFAHPLVEWPTLIFGNDWSNFPIWVSAIPVSAFAYTLGLHHRVRALSAGLAVGIGISLLWGAFTSTIAPWYMPVWVAFPWLVTNAAACGFIAMSLTGVQHLEEEHGATK